MSGIVVLILSVYCLWLLIMIIGWRNIPTTDFNQSTLKKVAIVIAFRNEVDNLPDLIKSLKSLHYDPNYLEIILIDDHSEDAYKEQLGVLPSNFRILQLPNGILGKKAAITLGIESTDAEIIITTDADCTFDPQWVNSIVGHFKNDNVQMVFGGVKFNANNTLFDGLQSTEFAPVIGVGAASAQLGQPFMCNGANLAFRKSAFFEVKGYSGNEEIASGDDEFLLHKINFKYTKAILFNKGSTGVVTTSPAHSLSGLLQQRKRWASKWRSNLNWYKICIALLVALNSVASVFAVLMLIMNFEMLLLFVLTLKVSLEAVFIVLVSNYLNKKTDALSFFLMQIIYPVYSLWIAIISNFGKYQWKGRVH